MHDPLYQVLAFGAQFGFHLIALEKVTYVSVD